VTLCVCASGERKARVPAGNRPGLPKTCEGTDIQTGSGGKAGGFFHWFEEGLGLAKPADEDFIKRVIGLPGETVEGRGGFVYVNGKKLVEPYLTQPTQPFAAVTVPAGKLFVMGDNRGNSLDSRFGLGFVPIDKVIGKAFITLWPPSRFGLLH